MAQLVNEVCSALMAQQHVLNIGRVLVRFDTLYADITTEIQVLHTSINEVSFMKKIDWLLFL